MDFHVYDSFRLFWQHNTTYLLRHFFWGAVIFNLLRLHLLVCDLLHGTICIGRQMFQFLPTRKTTSFLFMGWLTPVGLFGLCLQGYSLSDSIQLHSKMGQHHSHGALRPSFCMAVHWWLVGFNLLLCTAFKKSANGTKEISFEDDGHQVQILYFWFRSNRPLSSFLHIQTQSRGRSALKELKDETDGTLVLKRSSF